MNYLTQEDAQSEANNHVSKFEYNSQSTNVSAYNESMIHMDEVMNYNRIVQEAEIDLNIERRKANNQNKEKHKIEAQVYDEEQKKSHTELPAIKHRTPEKGMELSYISHQNLDEQLLKQHRKNREHYTKQVNIQQNTCINRLLN